MALGDEPQAHANGRQRLLKIALMPEEDLLCLPGEELTRLAQQLEQQLLEGNGA